MKSPYNALISLVLGMSFRSSVTNKLNLARFATLFTAILILAGSSIPGESIPKAFELTPDKLIHCFEYFVFGSMSAYWLILEFNVLKRVKAILYGLLIPATLGAIDENYQRLIPGRSPDFWDWVLDLIGGGIAALLVSKILLKNKGPKKAL